jgi:hypothetical protein
MVLAFGFTENAFYGRNWPKLHIPCLWPHILDRLYIMVMYISFYGFIKKIQILAQNPKVLAFAFTKKSRFLTKTDRNSIFHVQDSNILDQLYIMVLYIIFYSF